QRARTLAAFELELSGAPSPASTVATAPPSPASTVATAPPSPASTVAVGAPSSSGPKRLQAGETLGGHVIERVLGQGAMGAVFAARHAGGARPAIKAPIFGTAEDAIEQRARFEREALTLARLKPHPNVVQVHSAGVDGDYAYCVLELVDGSGLDGL